MDKRMIIGIVLVAIILILTPIYQKWVLKKETSVPEITETDSLITSVDSSAKILDTLSDTLTDRALHVSKIDSIVHVETSQAEKDSIPAAPEKIITVKTDKLTAKLTTIGADIKSIKLNDLFDYKGDLIEMAPGLLDSSNSYIEVVVDEQHFSTKGIHFVVDKEFLEIDEDNPRNAITMVGVLDNGIMIQRRYEFEYGKYHIRHSVFVSNPDSSKLLDEILFWWTGGLRPFEKNASWDIREISVRYRIGKDITREKPKKKQPNFSLDGVADWIGTGTKYFNTTIMPETEFGSQGVRGKFAWVLDTHQQKQLEIPISKIGLYNRISSPSVTMSYIIYTGPRDYFILKNYGRQLDKLVDLGWWWLSPITKGLLWLFKFLYKLIGNWGIVIIIFSILMKVVFLPIAHKQLYSMRKMKEIQPQVRSIQERLRDKPQQSQMEIMKLYKKHGVSPMSSCLPLIIQMPVFFALYRALAGGFLFRAQSFLWVKDLSQGDPYIIWPIIMSVTMFIQQKISVTDPKQKAMVYIMPLIFFFFFYKLPAGLVIYWTMFNILSIAHMLWVESQWQGLPGLSTTEPTGK